MLPNYTLTWQLKFVTVVIHDPFWLPSQVDAIKWGNQILVASMAFPMWHTWMGLPHFNCLGHLHKLRHLDRVTQFHLFRLPSQGDTPEWGDPILFTSIAFTRWRIWMGKPNLSLLSPSQGDALEWGHPILVTLVTPITFIRFFFWGQNFAKFWLEK